MRRVLVFVLAAVMTGGAGYVVAQTPAKKAPAQPAPPAAQRRVNMPPLTMPGIAPGRPLDQARAVYEFAAQHPEVLKFVPCYCGCESTGHPHNESCFVKRRDVQANVLEWDTHGYGWAICIDVARDAMLMYRSGADPVAIRSSIEKKWTPKYRTKTPTPLPPPKTKP